MPVIALVERDGTPSLPGALPIALDDSADRLVARLRSALRIRSLHVTVLRRARASDPNRQITVPCESARQRHSALRGPRRIVPCSLGRARRASRSYWGFQR